MIAGSSVSVGRRVNASSEVDAGRTRRLVALLTLLLLAWLAWAFVTPLVASFELRQAMHSETLYGPVNESPSRIQSRLLAVARRNGLDLEPREMRVEKRGPVVRVEARFTAPVDFGAGLVWHWRQRASYEDTRRPGALRGP